MFSALNQGSLVYILDKTDKPKFKIGQVSNVVKQENQYQSYLGAAFQNVPLDIDITIDGSTQKYSSIPGNLSLVTYNNGKITISETKQGLQQEVETILQNSRQIVDNIDNYKQNIIECESILKELNPQFAKDKERDEKLVNLEERFNGVESKLDKLITLMDK